MVDVAQALANLMHSRQIPGMFNLPGPSTLTIGYLIELVQSVAYLEPSRLPALPKPIALAIAKLAQLPWFPMVSPDEIERRYINDSDVAGDWEALGVRPDQIEDHILAFVRRFRSACVFLLWVFVPALNMFCWSATYIVTISQGRSSSLLSPR